MEILVILLEILLLTMIYVGLSKMILIIFIYNYIL